MPPKPKPKLSLNIPGEEPVPATLIASTPIPPFKGSPPTKSEAFHEEKPAQDQTQYVEQQPSISKARFCGVLIAAYLCFFLGIIDVMTVGAALPTMALDLKTPWFMWITSSYALSAAAFTPPAAGLANVFGRKPVLLVSLAIFLASMLITGCSYNLTLAIIGRVFAGLSGSSIIAVSQMLIVDLVPLSDRGRYAAITGLVTGAAYMIGPVLGGLWTKWNWRYMFFANAPAALICWVAVFFLVKVNKPQGTFGQKLKRVDWIGSLFFILFATATCCAVTIGGKVFKWYSWQLCIFYLLAGFNLIALVAWSTFATVKNPVIPGKLLKNRTSVVAFLSTMVNSLVFSGIFYYLPSYFQATHGDSPILSAAKCIAGLAACTIGFVAAGLWINKSKHYRLQLFLGHFITAWGAGCLVLVRNSTHTAVWVTVPMVVGLGIGMTGTASYIAAMSPLDLELQATGASFFMFMQNCGQTIGSLLGGILISNKLAAQIPASYQDLQGGHVYSAISIIPTLPEPLRTTVRSAFVRALAIEWVVFVPIVGVALLLCIALMKHHTLSTITEAQYGLKQDAAACKTVISVTPPPAYDDFEVIIDEKEEKWADV